MADWNDEDKEKVRRYAALAANIAYGIAGMAFVFLLLFGPRPYDALAMPLSMATPWITAYVFTTVVLFASGIVFAVRRDWGLTVAAFLFAGFSGGMLSCFFMVVQSGTW